MRSYVFQNFSYQKQANSNAGRKTLHLVGTLSTLLFVLTTMGNCQLSNPPVTPGDTSKNSHVNFLKQIDLLSEFKQEQTHVDSIKKNSGTQVQLQVQIVDSSFLTEDKGKNISLAFINENYPYDDNRIIYTVKFDKDKQKIISVEKNQKQLKQPVSSSTEDIPLPKKHS